MSYEELPEKVGSDIQDSDKVPEAQSTQPSTTSEIVIDDHNEERIYTDDPTFSGSHLEQESDTLLTTVSVHDASITIQRPGGRRRPRYLESSMEKDTTIVNRRNLLASVQTPNGKPQLSRERKIAGNLPDWDPVPPGELLIAR